MKHLLITLWLWCALTGALFSQANNLDPEETTRQLTARLDHTQVPSGILYERVPGWLPMPMFDGTRLADSLTVTAPLALPHNPPHKNTIGSRRRSSVACTIKKAPPSLHVCQHPN